MTELLRVVILTTKLPEDIWLINMIADVCEITGIVFPSGTRYREYNMSNVLRKRIRRLGIFRVIDQALLVLYRYIFEGQKDKKAVNIIFNNKPYHYIEEPNIDILEVEDINSDEVKDFIISKAPNIVIVSGVPILQESILNAVKGKIINLHPGFSPQYRGRYGSFWPIYNKEPELIGTTVQFIDEGIDTGAILLQKQVDFDPNDTMKAVRYKQHKLGGTLLLRCLQDFDNFAANAYLKTNCSDKNYIAPGLTHYIKAMRWLNKEKRNGKFHMAEKSKTR